MDKYHLDVLEQIKKMMEKDQYYGARLYGDDTKKISLTLEEIQVLIDYHRKTEV